MFESSYIAALFRAEIGHPPGIVRVVHNGVGEAEFAPIVPRPDATDIICLGELRPVKAFDVLIEALAILKQQGRLVSATIAGEGPDAVKLKAQAEQLGIADMVRLVGYRPAREVFAMGRMLVIPSRAELLPYVVLEAAAAGVPIISTGSAAFRNLRSAERPAHPAQDIAALIGAITTAIDNRRGCGASRNWFGPGCRPSLADRHGRRRACRLSRSPCRELSRRAIRITNF